MKQLRIGLTFVASGAILVLGACGDDDDDDGASTSIEATASEFQFEPDSGSTDHEWAVINLGEDIESEDDFAEEVVLLEVEALPAGEATEEQFTIDEPGTYQVICALEGHFDAGMEGTLTVE
jgi:uncharacterized cupredoxin-like copper-binding protein